MSRLRAIAAAGAVAVLGSLGWSATADAAGGVRFAKIYYDSPGSDTGSNTSLNAEFVTLKNRGTTRRNLSGWTIRDPEGHVYRFGTYYLGAGKSVRIHTGKGTNSRTDRYWGQSSYVWNNSGDKAILRNRAGTRIEVCSWSSIGVGYKYC